MYRGEWNGPRSGDDGEDGAERMKRFFHELPLTDIELYLGYYLLSTIYLVAERKYRAKDRRQTRFQSSNMPHIILLGTLDTKRTEVLFLYRQLQQNAARSSTPLEITLIDCGRQDTTDEAITFGHADLLSKYAASHSPAIQTLSRGQAIELLIDCVSVLASCCKRGKSTELSGRAAAEEPV